jgi:hypothetical protein
LPLALDLLLDSACHRVLRFQLQRAANVCRSRRFLVGLQIEPSQDQICVDVGLRLERLGSLRTRFLDVALMFPYQRQPGMSVSIITLRFEC